MQSETSSYRSLKSRSSEFTRSTAEASATESVVALQYTRNSLNPPHAFTPSPAVRHAAAEVQPSARASVRAIVTSESISARSAAWSPVSTLLATGDRVARAESAVGETSRGADCAQPPSRTRASATTVGEERQKQMPER